MGLTVAFAVGPATSQPQPVFAVCLVAGLLLSLWHSLRSQVQPLERRRQDIIRSVGVIVAFTLLVALAMFLNHNAL